jgi:hypothetical protein
MLREIKKGVVLEDVSPGIIQPNGQTGRWWPPCTGRLRRRDCFVATPGSRRGDRCALSEQTPGRWDGAKDRTLGVGKVQVQAHRSSRAALEARVAKHSIRLSSPPPFRTTRHMHRFAVFLFLLAGQVHGQVVSTTPSVVFGSATDPLETTVDPRVPGSARVAAFGGPSYIGMTWRLGAGVDAEGSLGPVDVALEGRLRAGVDGLYDADVDELYDVARLIRYVRHNPTERLPVYARLGPIKQVTLGYGDLVRDFATTAAWDQRSIGLEVAAALGRVEAAAFSEDVRLDGLIGGRLGLRPVATTRQGRPVLGLASLRLGGNLVRDLSLGDSEGATAISGDASFDLFALGDLRLTPYVSYARFLDHGQGLTTGVTIGSPALADLVRLGASVSLLFSTDGFIPGYFNAFYPVSNPHATIIDSDVYFRDGRVRIPVSIDLADAQGGISLGYDLEAGVLGLFEASHYFRRDFGRRTGAFGLRLVLVPEFGTDLRFAFEMGRQGLGGFRGIFSDLADEAILVFHVDYRFSGPFHVFLRSRYGYTQLDDMPDGRDAFLIERRFEPMVGIALSR